MSRQRVVIVQDRPNHVLHLLLSIITFGGWIPVWFLISAVSAIRRKF